MAERFSRWESDPLFSAAEIVQDSADRMESIYRLLLHEKVLLRENNPDVKLVGSIQLHRRDLVTALETTKWQLEDFERAVHFSAFSDKSNSRTDAISRHMEFVKAIHAQIGEVEKILDSTSGVYSYTRPDNLQELDTDGLAVFLSGGSSEDNHVEYHPNSNYQLGFCESTSRSNEIVEVKPEEADVMPLNFMKNPDQNFDFAKDKELSNGLSSSNAMNYDSPQCWGFYQMSLGNKDIHGEHGVSDLSDLEVGESNAKCFSTKSRITAPVSGFMSKLWYLNMNKLTRGFTKRRKDGELTDDYLLDNMRRTPSNHNVNSVEQVYSNVGSLLKRFQRVLTYVKYGNIPIRMQLTSAILIALLILGLMAFHS